MRVLTRIAIALIVILMSVVSTATTRLASAQNSPNGCYVASGITESAGEWLVWWAGLPTGWYGQYSMWNRDYVDMRTLRSWRLFSTGARIVGWTQWQFSGTVLDYSLESGWSPDDGAIVNGYVYVNEATDFATAEAVRQQTYLCTLDSSPYTPTPAPSPTPDPTSTPTPTSGSGSGGSGSGGGGGGTATPPPDWCGFVPTNPCYVEWVSWRTAIAELPTSNPSSGSGGGDVDAQRTAAAALSTMVALPTATPEYAQARQTAEAALTAGPAPVPYAGGEEIANAESDLGVTEVGFVLRRYNFGCPLRYVEWGVEVCITYVHIQGLRLGPAVISDWVFVGALALVALGFLVRR